MDKYVGKRLDGRYEIQEIIGIGGMAVVYKAHDNIENRTVAIKILKDEFVSNDEFIRRFKNESRAIAMLSHPNIVKVYDVSFGDLIQYIVMEYISGVTLKEYIEHKGCLRWKDAVYFTVQILKALQHAHDKGIIHRDVKPQNIMVLQDGSIKVTDFGIARFSRSEQRTVTDKAIGSVHYISPEQAKGEKTDEKADIYSVGVMLYEMLTGRLPFDAERAVSVAIMQLQSNPKLPTEINPSIPLGLEQITMHAMQKLTERRYQSAAEMLCDLERFRKDPEVTFEYSYFVDNSPTKFVTTEPIVPSGDNRMSKTPVIEDEQEEKKSGLTIPVLAGIATALVAVLVIIGIIFIPRLFQSTKDITCPDFIGKTKKEIQESKYFVENTFIIDFIDKVTDDESKVGKAVDQTPAKGKKLKKGATIKVYIGVAEESDIKVPDVLRMSRDDLEEALKEAGIENYELKYEEASDKDVDTVVKIEPAPGTKLKKGQILKIYIGKAKEKDQISVPKLLGKSESEAKKKLIEDGFVADSIKVVSRPIDSSDKNYYNENYSSMKGKVIAQKPEADVKADSDAEITIYISSGIKISNYKVSVSPECENKDNIKTAKISIDKSNATLTKPDGDGYWTFVLTDGVVFEYGTTKKATFSFEGTDSEGKSFVYEKTVDVEPFIGDDDYIEVKLSSSDLKKVD